MFQASFGGASATVEILELVAIELGGNYFLTGPMGTGAEFFTRAGVSPTDPHFYDTTHLFSPSEGVQATYWITPHFGFNMRLSGGVRQHRQGVGLPVLDRAVH